MNTDNFDESDLILWKSIFHETANILKKFKGRLTNTIVLTPYGSSTIALDIKDRHILIGLQGDLYRALEENVITKEIVFVHGSTGLYIVYNNRSGTTRSIRIFVRKKRVKAILKGLSIGSLELDCHMVLINAHGHPLPRQQFTVPIRALKERYWD